MKKIFLALVTVSALFLQSCEGPIGPPGPAGIDGGSILGQAFEAELTFNASNQFSGVFNYPTTVGDKGAILESDVILVYLLERVQNNLDVWEKIPMPRYFGNGVYHYGFDFTTVDFSIFMEGNFNLSTLPSNATTNKIFRVVVVPADFAKTVDTNDINAVLKGAGIAKEDIVQF